MAGLAALQYAPDGFDTRLKLMGRQKAGETFLKAWIDHAGADPLTGWTHRKSDNDAFIAHARALGHAGAIASSSEADFTALGDAGALWLADPALAPYTWQRRWGAQTAWSIVGITHTMSSHSAMDRVAALLTAPTQRWDALICTSNAIKSAVVATLDAEADYLRARIDARALTGPQLPVIPLGVPCAALAHDPAARAAWRTELGIADDEVAILAFGRLSLHTKAHPLPLYLALAAAAARDGLPKLRLILAGQFVNSDQDSMFRALAGQFAPVVRTDFVDGARADVDGVRAAADIFALLSDNIQESFGIAPVEAMAAGLPVIGSDWDGLRDTIEHGVTGFRIDTVTPPPGTGEALARLHALNVRDNDYFVGATAQSTAVDVGQAADAFAALAANPELRRTMGEAGRRRALASYDWPVVIAAYRALLDDLAARRSTGEGERARRGPDMAAVPSRLDPFRNFAAHATAQLHADTLLDRAPGAPARGEGVPGGIVMARPVAMMLPPPATMDRMIGAIAGGPLRIGDLAALFADVDGPHLYAAIGWLLKFGFLRRV